MNAIYSILINTPMAAIFGTTAKNAVIEVGAPSYTSGVHIWNGAIDSLKAIDDKINTIENINKRELLS